MKYLETNKPFFTRMLKIALPVAAQSIITTGVNLVDTIMLGQLNETALSASSLANQFITLFVFLMMGISMGVSVLVSRYWGARDIVSLKKAAAIAIRFGLIIALGFTIVNFFLPETIMSLYIHDVDVIQAGAIYLRWSTITFVLVCFSTILTNIMRSISMSHIPLIAAVCAFFINIGANYIFIFGKLGAPAMGIAGAALGTVIARLVEAGLICGYFFLYNKKMRFRIRELFSKCGDMLPEFLRVALPVVLSDGLLGIGDNVLAMIMGRVGSAFVSANAITNAVSRVSTIFVTGLAFSSCFITGQTLGEGEPDRAKRQGNTFLLMGFAFGILAAAIIQIISRPILNAYNIASGTRDIAAQLMNAISVIIIFRSTNSILTKGVLRGGGDTRFLLLADMSTLWLAAIPLGALASFVLHVPPFWIYISLHADQIIKAVWCVFRLKGGKWIKKIKSASLYTEY